MANIFHWNKAQGQLIKGLGFSKGFDLYVAETSARYMNPFVPMRDGFLSQTYETGADDISGFVRYTMPYAHYQYNGVGFNFSKEQHPLATHHWDKAMMASKGDQFLSEINLARTRFIL